MGEKTLQRGYEITAHKVAAFTKLGPGFIVAKNGTCNEGFSDADRPEESDGCDLACEVKYLGYGLPL